MSMRESFTLITLCLVPLAFSSAVWAQTFEFRSRLDSFTVNVSGKTATLDNVSVSTSPMDGVFTLFTAQFEDACDMGSIGRPDLTVTRTTSDGVVAKRMIYISSRLISDGKSGCGKLTGQGLYTLPFHRKWFENESRVTIALKDQFSIWKDGKKVVEFQKTEDGYRNTDSHFATNWEFFDKFVFALKNFPIDFRAHPDAAKDFTGFELRDSGRTFKFVKVGDITWAVQFPGVPWLAASGQLGVFGDMNPKVWLSPHADMIKKLSDRTATDDARLKAANAIFDRWVPDVKNAFYAILLETEESANLRRDLATLLKRKPTDENFKILLKVIQKEKDNEMLSHLTKILRIKNPKGPVVQLDDDDITRNKKIKEWLLWGRTHKFL